MGARLSQIWRTWKQTIIGVVIGSVLAFLVRETASGLIEGTLSKWIIERLIPWLPRSRPVSHWLLLVLPIGSGLLIGLIVAIVAMQRRTTQAAVWLDLRDAETLKYAAAYLYTRSFLELLASIDDDLRQSVEDRNRASSLKDFIESFFIQTLNFLGPEVRTGVIFRPNKDDPEWLAAWQANPGHIETKKTFYIGKDENRFKDRGCAGEAFIENESIKYNIIDEKTGRGDHPRKKIFEDYEKRIGGPDYLSSVSLPIHWNKKVVGVLCIDSKQRNFFSDEMVALLQVIADRIGDALYLHGELEQQPP